MPPGGKTAHDIWFACEIPAPPLTPSQIIFAFFPCVHACVFGEKAGKGLWLHEMGGGGQDEDLEYTCPSLGVFSV